MHQLSTAVADEEEDVEDVVADGVDDKEVGRPDPVEMLVTGADTVER